MRTAFQRESQGRGGMGLGLPGCLGRPVKQLRLVSKRKTAGSEWAKGSRLESRGQTLKAGVHPARRLQRTDPGRRKQPWGD